MKLRKLWTDNKYFSHEVEERFNMHIVEYKQVILSSQSNRLSDFIFSFSKFYKPNFREKSLLGNIDRH